jgi:SSS family solute:Na+ symporter
MTLSTLTIVAVVIYMLIIFGVGYLAHRSSSETLEDYFVGGRKTGTIALIGTIVATKVNGLALTTAPGFIYEGGILFSQTFIALAVSCFLLLHYGPQIWTICKQNNFITQAELFGHYYQSPAVYTLTALLGICSIFPFLIVQFAAVAKVFSAATGNLVTYEQSILFLGVATGLYIFLGGAKAVIWTDVFQGILLLSLILLTAYLFTDWAGGLNQGITTVMHLIPEKLVFNSQNTPVFFDQVLSWSFAFFLWPQVFQRAMMGRSAQVISRAAWGHFWIGFIVKVALLIIGIMATATLYGQIADSDRLVATMYHQNLPLGGILIVLAVFACGMSTIDSVLLSLSSIFTRDIAEKLLPSPLPESDRYHLAQAISALILIVTAALALSTVGRGYLAPLVTLGATFATLLLWPLVGLFTWKKGTKEGVVSAILLGLGSLGLTQALDLFWHISIAIGSTTIFFLVSLVSFLGVSLLTQPRII